MTLLKYSYLSCYNEVSLVFVTDMTQKGNTNSLQEFLGKWQAHFDRIQASNSLSKSEIKKVVNGLTKLREVFDDAWLWDNAGAGFIHPMLSHLGNYSPRSQLSLADFGRKLDALKDFTRFDTLVRRLKNSKEYLGAKAEVETVAKLIAASITDIELYPKLKIGDRQKQPDLRATVGGIDIYLEVATLAEPENSIKAGQLFNELVFPFDPEIIRFCQLHKVLAKPRIEEFKAKIQSAISEVKQTKQYCYIGEPGVLDYLVIHPSKWEECDALAKRFGMKQEVTGPPVQRDDVRRLNRTLQIKSRQLPTDEPGLIIVFADLIYFESARDFYENLVYDVEDTIYDQGNLVAGVVISNVGEFGESEAYEKPQYTLVRKSSNGLVEETVIVIRNRYSRFSELDAVDRVFNAFVS